MTFRVNKFVGSFFSLQKQSIFLELGVQSWNW